MVNLCIPTLTRYDLLAQCIESAMKGSVKPDTINIVDNGGKFIENFGDIKEIDSVPLNLFVPKIGYSLASSFNRFMHTLDDHIIISNDDAIFHEKTIELLVKAAEDNPNELFIVPSGYWEWWWSLFLQKKDSLAIVGEYDSNFKPAYFEDADMKYRLKLAGYEPFVVKDCTYTHDNNGSNTIKSESVDKVKFNQSFAQSSEYFTQKWGGLRNNESFTKPFNLLG